MLQKINTQTQLNPPLTDSSGQILISVNQLAIAIAMLFGGK